MGPPQSHDISAQRDLDVVDYDHDNDNDLDLDLDQAQLDVIVINIDYHQAEHDVEFLDLVQQ